ncbi:MAG TPA: hypothetical protein VF972_11635, partial [Actinomycetota bacterium]
AGAATVTLTLVRPSMSFLVPLVVAGELIGSGVAGHTSTVTLQAQRAEESKYTLKVLFPPHRLQPVLDISSFFAEGPIPRTIASGGGARYLSVDPARWKVTGYTVLAPPESWPMLGRQQSMIFGLSEAQGYNPVQERRYWEFVRAVEPKQIRYSAASFLDPPPVALDLLQVAWVIGPPTGVPVAGATPVVRQGDWELYRLPNPPPRASLLTSWQVVRTPDAALHRVVDGGFDPEAEAILEQDPGIAQHRTNATGTAAFTELGPQAARIEVDAPAPGIVLVRQTYDPDWHATVDGRVVAVLPADYLDQGIPVPPGHHVISLTYNDPWVGWGLLGSGVALALLLGTAGGLAVRQRRSYPRPPVPDRVADVR